MKNLLSLDSPLMTGLSKIADLFILNILFVVCCIPVFTIGASTTALYYVTLKMVKDEECYPVKSFFKSFKLNFLQATGIWLIILAVSSLLMLDFRIMNGGFGELATMSTTLSKAVIIVLLVTILMMLFVVTFVFPILAKFDNTVKNTLRNAFLMSIRHFPCTIAIIVINVLPIVLYYLIPPLFILITISFAGCAFACSFIFNKLFSKYIPEEAEITSDDNFSINPETDSFLFSDNKESNEEITEE